MTNRTLTRRHALLGICACCCASLAEAEAPAKAEGAAPIFTTEEVAQGIHIRRGVHQDATLANDGAIANIGFIVGDKAVAVMDPGASLVDGQRLRAAIRKTTGLPITH